MGFRKVLWQQKAQHNTRCVPQIYLQIHCDELYSCNEAINSFYAKTLHLIYPEGAHAGSIMGPRSSGRKRKIAREKE